MNKKIIASALALSISCGTVPASAVSAEEISDAPQSPYYDVVISEALSTPSNTTSYTTYVGEERFIVEDKENNTFTLVDSEDNALKDLTGSRECSVMGFGYKYSEGLLARFYSDTTADIETDADSNTVYVYNDIYEYYDTDGNAVISYTDTERRTTKRPTGYNGGGYDIAGFLEGDKRIYYAHNLEAFHDGFAAFHSFENNGYGFFDKTGTPITKDYYYEVFPFAGKGAVVAQAVEGTDEYNPERRYGIIGTDGEYILPCEHKSIQAMDENWFNVDGSLYYLNESGDMELKFSSADVKNGSTGTYFYAGEGIIGVCSEPEYMPYRYSYFYDMETKELLTDDAFQIFDPYDHHMTPYLSDGWNHLVSKTTANFFNNRLEKLVDTDKAVMQWDKSKDYFVLRETTGENEYSYEIVNSKLETVVQGGMFINGSKFIGCDENGYYSASFASPDTRRYLPYDSITMLASTVWSDYSDREKYSNLYLVSRKDGTRFLDKGVIDIDGNLLVENKYENINFTYETGLLRAYTINWDDETNSFKTTYDDYFSFIEKAPAAKTGDVNGDGLINAVDASKILVFFAQLQDGVTEATENDFAACDVNGDGVINAVDATLVLVYSTLLAEDPSLKLEDFVASRN